MRVLMTADAVGGVWTYALDLCRALTSRGDAVTLAVMGRAPSDDQRAEADSVPGLTIAVGAYKLEWEDDPWADIDAAGRWLLDLARETRADLVHLNGYAHAALPFAAPTVVVAHSCVLSWWRAVKNEPAPRSWDRYALAVRAGLRAADAVVAPTAAMAYQTATHYGLPPEAVRVIPNGRDAARYRPSPRKEPSILAAGRLWDEAKNVAALAAVADGLRWPVGVAGEGRFGPPRPHFVGEPDTEELHTGSASPSEGSPTKWGRGGPITPLGRLTPAALADALSRAAVYAQPARYEPFGLSVLEAALSGCALVLGDISSLRENWDGAAVFVAPDDHDGLRDALNRLADDDGALRYWARAARERAADPRFTVGAMADAYRLLYRELTDGAALAAAADDEENERTLTGCAS